MVGEMVKKQGREELHISCNYSWTLYFSVRILLFKLKNLHIKVKANLWHNKTETKYVKAVKMMEFIKTYD